MKLSPADLYFFAKLTQSYDDKDMQMLEKMAIEYVQSTKFKGFGVHLCEDYFIQRESANCIDGNMHKSLTDYYENVAIGYMEDIINKMSEAEKTTVHKRINNLIEKYNSSISDDILAFIAKGNIRDKNLNTLLNSFDQMSENKKNDLVTAMKQLIDTQKNQHNGGVSQFIHNLFTKDESIYVKAMQERALLFTARQAYNHSMTM